MGKRPSLDAEEHAIRMSDCLTHVGQEQSRSDFAVLFDYYAPRLKSFFLRRGASNEEAEELVQEIMATVWAKAAQYDPDLGTVSTWIFRIARNRQIDKARRRRPPLDPNDPMLRPIPAELPDKRILRSEVEARVRAAMRTLPHEQVQLLRASFYLGLPHAEIAAKFELPLGTVKSRIRLAFEKMRRNLENT